MPEYVAFLRAINVGGHIVKMDALRRLFEGLDFANVETFIASGNVRFAAPAADRPALEAQMEAQLEASLGYPVATFLRTPAEVAGIAAYRPFAPAELEAAGNRLYVALLAEPPAGDRVAALLAYRSEVDDLHVHGREVYWLYRRPLGASRFSAALLEKALGRAATVRNMNTIRRLAAKGGK
ncbi:MAG: DUF1697 domain-containing protein [Candidatus Promineifilaceae bacterium]